MTKTTIQIDGMMCGMCEAHINEAIRRHFQVKKVTASHSKGEAVIIAEAEPDFEKLKAVINETGYTPGKITSEPYTKRGLFSIFS